MPARRSRTRDEFIASLDWNIRDAEEALRNAIAMRDWAGVIKYAQQIRMLEGKKYTAEAPTGLHRSLKARDIQHAWIGEGVAGQRFGRGRLP